MIIRYTKLIRYFIGLVLFFVFLILFINLIVLGKSNKFIFSDIQDVPKCYTGIVLGALVYQSGNPSDYLQDRMDKAIELYKSKKITRFLLSGDHGQLDYDEVNNMKLYLTTRGIDSNDIFLDHAGFDTYSSMYRAKEIFQVTDAIVISQSFHLPRAVYIARRIGLNAFGFVADKRIYSSTDFLKKREILANIKAYFELMFHIKPKYLGDEIPITGKSDFSYD